jgi:YHS domain-containing protein
VFCNPRCQQRFEADPDAFLKPAAAKPAPTAAAAEVVEWTCPMHPEIVRNAAGSCPICGMALEPRTVSATEGENPELTDMRRRLWVSAGLTVPWWRGDGPDAAAAGAARAGGAALAPVPGAPAGGAGGALGWLAVLRARLGLAAHTAT